MNYVEFGRRRDDRIVELVHRGGAFTRMQLQEIFFKQKDAKRKAQLRLRVLSEQGRVGKYQRSVHEPTIYYGEKLSKRILDHQIAVNDVYTAVMTQKPSTLRVVWHWEYTIMETIRADAMIDIYDLMAKKRYVTFLEMERYADHRFNKDKNYESITKMDWTREEWAIREDKRVIFPSILVVTDTKISVKSDLDFMVAPLTAVKSDVYSILLRR